MKAIPIGNSLKRSDRNTERGNTVLNLLIIMLERVGTIIAVAFILTRFQFFKNMIDHNKLEKRHEITAIIFFGLFGVMGTYLGFALNVSTSQFDTVLAGLVEDEAIANSRVIGVVIAGLLGGYRVGIGAGLIAGLHRMTLGGFTAFACGLSTIIAGFLASAFYKKGKNVKPIVALAVGAGAEALQMGLIIILSKPFEKAMALVEVIGIPMIFANGIGAALFMLIIHSVVGEKEKATALQAQKTLRIADQTLGHLQKGMNNATALAVCNILYRELQPAAVAMTDRHKILAHVGIASVHHEANSPVRTEETKNVLETGQLVVIKDGSVHCNFPNCPLTAVIVAPLTHRDETIGTLKIYYSSEKEIKEAAIELIHGLSSLLSNQLAIAEADRAHQLAKEAEIKALQAQISPHFLFNSINIIMSLIRSRPNHARKLLKSLSCFLRQNVTESTSAKTSLKQELSHVKAYLEIIEARFIDRLVVQYEVDEALLEEKIPPFTLQPIVENAIHHGINDMDENCFLKVSVADMGNEIEIRVEDNGKGIPEEQLKFLGNEQLQSKTGTGMGLYNVNRRLKIMFGDRAELSIKSEKNKGTTVAFHIPKTGGE